MQHRPVLITAPADTPVSVAQAKLHCRVDHTDDDDLFEALIAAATKHLDAYTGILGRALVTQTWRQDFDRFANCLRLPIEGVVTVDSVAYYDTANVGATLSSSIYELLVDEFGPYVSLLADQVWPSTYSRARAVSVTFTAGDEPADVPEPIRQAMLLLIGHWYQNREAAIPGGAVALQMAVDALLAPYRRVGV